MTAKRFNKKRTVLAAAILLMLAALVLPAGTAKASGLNEDAAADTAGDSATESGSGSYEDSDPDDYITKRFDVTATADTDHTVHITEVIDVQFVQGHHGISRYIPQNHDEYKIKNLKCEGEEYSVSSENGDRVLRVGDEDKLVYGDQEYVVSYDLVFRRDQTNDMDTLSVDLLPTGWDTSIREASVRLEMPKPVDPDAYEFYLGFYSSTGFPEGNTAETSDDGKTVTFELSNLKKGWGLTVYAMLEEGYWENAPVWMTYSQIWVVIVAGMGAAAVLLYIFFGRDPKSVETVEFYPPDNLTPAEVGYIIDGTVDDSDMGSMILYFASKGCLKIREYKKNKFELIKLRDLDETEKPFARTLFRGFFGKRRMNKNKEIVVRMDSLPKSMYDTVTAAKSQVTDYYAAHRMFRGVSTAMRYVCLIAECLLYGGTLLLTSDISWLFVIAAEALLIAGMAFLVSGYDRRKSSGSGTTAAKIIAGAALMVCATLMVLYKLMIDFVGAGDLDIRTCLAILKYTITPGQILTAVLFPVLAAVIFLCGLFMPCRTKEGAALYGRILGFRNFIRDAEYDKMKELSDRDPEYFYTIMPYAYVLGMSTEFAKKFADIQIKSPDWYESGFGDDFRVSPIWYGSMIHSMNNSFVSASSHPVDSGGGGFFGGGSSGGGFAGGGGGGGGGGAW